MLDTMLPNRLGLLRREMDHLLRDFFGGTEGDRFGTPVFPALNILEDEHTVFIEAELPGVRIEDVDISVAGDQLTLRGERKADDTGRGACHRREREVGRFTRIVRLPAPVDSARVRAALKNGVLTVSLPKSEQARPRRIEVKSA